MLQVIELELLLALLLILQPQQPPAIKIKRHGDLRQVKILMLYNLPSIQVNLIQIILFVVELILQYLPFLRGIGTEDHLHILVQEGHGVRADGVVVVALDFLELVAEVLVVEDYALAVADYAEGSAVVDVDLSGWGLYGTDELLEGVFDVF